MKKKTESRKSREPVPLKSDLTANKSVTGIKKDVNDAKHRL
jgi:hypothetical protein